MNDFIEINFHAMAEYSSVEVLEMMLFDASLKRTIIHLAEVNNQDLLDYVAAIATDGHL